MKKAITLKRLISFFLSISILFALIGNLTSCTTQRVNAQDLMKGITGQSVPLNAPDDKFYNHMADFYLKLFKKTLDENENSLISPLSVLIALAMTANGADNETLEQLQTYLGGEISLPTLNEYLYYYLQSLPSINKSKLNIANSIWFRDDEDRLTVEKDFLQKNANYYNAAAHKSPFDNSTLADINNWVKSKTDGMIDKILDQIDEDTVMYLINAVVFDAEWKRVYNKDDIKNGQFTDISGQKQTAKFMFSEENLYIDNARATGFIKPYANDLYSFVAILPKDDISLMDYIAFLTGEEFLRVVNSAQPTLVNAFLPKFSYDYTIKMNDGLKELGIPKAFSSTEADFSKLGRSARGNIYIGEVLHKTFISVDELGTKAGAVTKVEMKDESYSEAKTVKLDRPFVYAIIDNATGLPIFIGTVNNLK